ncbi:unnamed protein product [Adineta ricciae]|uniref:Uncharacterized protein n=1 Tax=Adineta ricciae TaxID=249248 RepID=A0A814BMZ7_ADIRI|nr:unnamed protein product [Adineta ricciae]CAF1165316.1 unnamed protein product [Adineta ricciae]
MKNQPQHCSLTVSTQRQPCRLDWAQSSPFRWLYVLFWFWLNPIFNNASKHKITDEHLFDVSPTDHCQHLINKLEIVLKTFQHSSQSINTKKIIAKTFWKETIFIGLLLFPYFAAKIAQPLLLKQIIIHISDINVSSSVIYLYAITLGLVKTILVLIHHQYFFHITRIGMHIRISLSTFIYKTLLSLPNNTIRTITFSQVFNLISNDLYKFEQLFVYIHFLWAGPFQALIIFIFVWNEIGIIATLFGYAVLLIQIPLQLYFSSLFRFYRKATIQSTDERIKIINEMLMANQIIKMYQWEEALEHLINQIRSKEIQNIQKANRIRSINMAIHFFSLSLISFATFAGSWFIGKTLSSVTIFTVLSFFGIMKDPLTVGFPYAIETISECSIASQRIDQFMNLSNTNQSQPAHHHPHCDCIELNKASFTWDSSQSPQLIDLDVKIKSGSFVAIIGSTASGKSSLLAAILGEMFLVKGQRNVFGNIAYVSQIPWIFTGTIRENILFYQNYDQQKYEQVLESCCLVSDLQRFTVGDETMIGEKGVNLSGGQKVRIALARALYMNADIYLFDDPLAAVDSHVAQIIFQQCFSQKSLLKNKTRLLVTHQTQFLSQVDYCILLDHGHIQQQTSFTQLTNIDNIKHSNHFNTIHQNNSTTNQFETHEKHSIIKEETSKDGTVNTSIWFKLFTSSYGWKGFVFLIFFMLLGETLLDTTNKWLSVWSSTSEQQQQKHHFYIYLGLTITTCLIALFRAHVFFHLILRSASIFHTKMLKGVLYTSLTFYESNPIGRILNRMSKDQQILDEQLPGTFFDAMQSLFMTIGSIIIIAMANPWILLILLFIIPSFIWFRKIYLRVSRQVKRLESTSRSSIYALFSSSFNGLMTIRAFQVQQHFLNSFMDKINANTRALFIFNCSTRWFALRLDLLTCCFTFVTAILSVILRQHIDSSSLALALVYVINLSELFQWGVRQSAETENFMISAERIDEYAHLPIETGFDEDEIQPPIDWPSQGNIQFKEFHFTYRPELEPVLKGINLNIKSHHKIGIIGRTGAGKSSIFQALFRLTDKSTVTGQLLIDGIDISRISLRNLRSKLNVIPQSPVLFSNTLRYNLDPFRHYTDEQIWNALEAVQLKSKIANLEDQLNTKVAEYGNNWSVGECQLICVARAILKPSQILLIDEATAHIDMKTDHIIQQIIRDKFRNYTILTIAHRLNTIIDNDRIVIMNNGIITNYGIPQQLLSHIDENQEEEETDTYL